MTNFAAPATEVFQLLQSFDYTVMLYGEDGNRVEDPSEARRMFARPENLMVSLIDDGDDSCVRLYIGNKTGVPDIIGLLTALRTSASKYNLLFNVRQYGREIQPKDFAGEATIKESKKGLSTMHVTESMYGTSKSSYLKLENARMIVRHSAKVDETKAGARSRCVESILIENALGERMRFPTNNLSAGRAMTQHVSMGGKFDDTVSEQIIEMAQTFSHLAECSAYVAANGATLSEAAGAIREQCRTKMQEMKKVFERMYRSNNGYQMEAKKMEDAARTLNETDATENEVSPEAINELRTTLNLEGSSYLSDAVCESVCKVCRETCNATEEIPEAAPPVKMVSVLGRPVNADAWEQLKGGKIELFSKPQFSDTQGQSASPTFVDKSSEMLNRLDAIVPVVKDDSLMNLLSFVSDRLPEERDPVVAKKMRTLVLFVIKAAGMSMNEGLAESNLAIRDFGKWVRRFETNQALAESYFGSNPWEKDDSEHEEAIAKAIDDFSAEEFINSKFGTELTSSHEKGDEDHITTGEIKSALESYFTDWIETYCDQHVEDTGSIADEKMGEVIAHLARDGFMVKSDDEVDEGDMSDADFDLSGHDEHREILDDCDMMEDMGEMDEGDLTREDVLLPNPNQGQNLAREVTPHTVKDPDTGKDKEPDSAYINRLRSLAGMTSPNRQF